MRETTAPTEVELSATYGAGFGAGLYRNLVRLGATPNPETFLLRDPALFRESISGARRVVPPRSGLQNRLGPEFGPVVRHRDSEFSCALLSMLLKT